MKSKGIIALTITALLGTLLVPSTSYSQIIQGITLERLGILSNRGTGARPFALGGAYTAVSDDAYALMFNPAGLAQIRRKEMSFGLHHTQSTISNEYSRVERQTGNSTTRLGHISAVYPIPTYRGSLVFAFGVFGVGSSDLEYARTGLNYTAMANMDNYFNQSGTTYKYLLGMGVDISPRLSVGANLAIWDQSIDFTEEIYQEYTPDNWALYQDNVSTDLDGISFDLGLLMRFNQYLRAGFSFTSPVWLDISGTGTDVYEADDWITDPLTANIEEQYTLPMRFTGGISANLPYTLISADVSYTDYSQTKYDGLELINPDDITRDVLEETWDLHLGAEFTIPVYPVKLRAGYSYTPLATTPLEEITYIDEEELQLITEWDYYETVKERQYFTFGVGGLIDRVLKLDLAVAIGEFERETSYLTEKREFTEVILSGAYRF